MANKLSGFFQRILIFQFIFLFIFSKVKNPEKNLKDFSKRIKQIARYNKMSGDVIEFIGNKSHHIFIFLFTSYFLCGILAILDFSVGKKMGGLATILMAMIYCNPITTIIKNMEKNKNNTQDWKLFIPSLEFCLISILGIIMISSSYYSKDDNEEKKKEETTKDNKKSKKDNKEKVN